MIFRTPSIRTPRTLRTHIFPHFTYVIFLQPKKHYRPPEAMPKFLASIMILRTSSIRTPTQDTQDTYFSSFYICNFFQPKKHYRPPEAMPKFLASIIILRTPSISTLRTCSQKKSTIGRMRLCPKYYHLLQQLGHHLLGHLGHILFSFTYVIFFSNAQNFTFHQDTKDIYYSSFYIHLLWQPQKHYFDHSRTL